MKFDWQQLSPGEREVLLRHFLLKRKMDAPVTAEKICAALQSTHSLSCYSVDGKLAFQFVTERKGVRSGASLADDFSEGVFKAALRARGVEVDDSFGVPAGTRKTQLAARAH